MALMLSARACERLVGSESPKVICAWNESSNKSGVGNEKKRVMIREKEREENRREVM